MVEVLISGAGPAGAVAALVLARRGVRVLLVDRGRLPREASGGVVLSPRAMASLAALGLDAPIAARARVLNGMRIVGPAGDAVADYPGSGRGRAMARRDFARGLIEAAVAAGAQVREGVEVVEPLVDRGRVRGAALMTGGRRVRVPAGVTIAAEGRQAGLARALGLVGPGHAKPPALYQSFEGVEGPVDRTELHLRRHRCVRLAPMPDGTTDVLLVTVSGRGAPEEATTPAAALRADSRLERRFAGARVAGPLRTCHPLLVDVPVAGTDGLLLAGDAAGAAWPLGDDGVRLAVRGGALAADVALLMLEDGRLRGHVELTWRRQLEFEATWRANRWLRAAVTMPAGVHVIDALARWAPPLLCALVAVAGDAGPAGLSRTGSAPEPCPVGPDCGEDRASRGEPPHRAQGPP